MLNILFKEFKTPDDFVDCFSLAVSDSVSGEGKCIAFKKELSLKEAASMFRILADSLDPSNFDTQLDLIKKVIDIAEENTKLKVDLEKSIQDGT